MTAESRSKCLARYERALSRKRELYRERMSNPENRARYNAYMSAYMRSYRQRRADSDLVSEDK